MSLGFNVFARAFSGGAGHAASRHWSAQRLTAIVLVPLAIWFLVALLTLPDLAYATVHAWVARPLSATLLCLLVVFLFWHSRLGVQVVIEDYVHHPLALAITVHLSTLLHLLAGGAALLAILRIALGNA
ncbi:MAG: succinate dehydrogenase, hydrophobic membrane anchor protein [Pseudomonadota bacterium]